MTQLAALISLMDSVSTSAVSTLVIKPLNKGSALVAVSADCTVQITAPGLTLGGLKDPIAVDSKTLLGACKNRDVDLSISGTEISVKSGKSYYATVACSDDIPTIQEGLSKLDDDAQEKVELTQDNLLAIKSLMAQVKIERTYTGIVDTLISVRATDKSLTLMNYEPAQVSSSVVKNASGVPDCFFVLPANVLTKALNIIGPMRITISESCVVFHSKQCIVRVNLPIDTINAIDKNAVLSLVQSVKATDKDKPSLTTTKSALKGFLDNAESVITVSGDVVVAPATGSFVSASVTTAKGSVKEKFAGSASKGFSLSYAFMRAIVNKSPEDTAIDIKTTDSFAVVKRGQSTYVASLSES